MYDIKFQPGDLCSVKSNVSLDRIILIRSIVDETYYEYEGDYCPIGRCHVYSIMSHFLQLLQSNISSLQE